MVRPKPPTRKRPARRSASTRLAGPRKPARRRRRTTKRSRTAGFKGLIFKWVLLLFLAALLIAGIWLWRLNQTVIAGFELSQTGVPMHLYSRPYEIAPGDAKSKQEIIKQLRKRGYSEVGKISRPRQFAYKNQLIDIYAPRQPSWQFKPQAQAARIALTKGKVARVIDHTSGQPLTGLELAPVLVGNVGADPVQDRLEIQLHEAPELLLDAVLTMEDRRFMQHPGVDMVGILRAVWSHLKPNGHRQGGSTLTQQLVKNVYLDSSRTLKRKLKEVVMALLVERNFSKSEILQRYINTLFLGQSGNRAIHGFALAAQYYYGRDLANIDAGQLAMLVGMIPAPSAYNPVRHPQRATLRRNLVLRTLAQNGFISPQELALYQAKELGVGQGNQAQRGRYPVFIDLMNEQLEQDFQIGLAARSGIDLYTTLDVDLQQSAEQSFKLALHELEQKHNLKKGFLQGAMMIVKPQSGEIVAIIGSSDNQVAGFNRALHARRPIGSLIKPAVYLTALQNPQRYSLVSTILDEPVSVPLDDGEVWQPRNYDNQGHGSPSIYTALAHSYNIPAVKVGLEVGVKSVLTTLKRLGVKTQLPAYPSLILGAADLSVLEITQMYQTIANNGRMQPLHTLRIVASRDGDPLSQHATKGQQTINPAAVYLLNTALQEVTRTGTGQALQRLLPGVNVAGKTGTTNDYRDSWFAGFGKNYLAVVWVGNDANQSTGLTGSSGALRAWSKVMQGIDLQPLKSAVPAQVEWASVDPINGELAVEGCTLEPVSRAFVVGYGPSENEACSGSTLERWIGRWFGDGRADRSVNSPFNSARNNRGNSSDPEVIDRSPSGSNR